MCRSMRLTSPWHRLASRASSAHGHIPEPAIRRPAGLNRPMYCTALVASVKLGSYMEGDRSAAADVPAPPISKGPGELAAPVAFFI